MWTKRYNSSDLESTVVQTKSELGSDAVVAAHQKIIDGVEVTVTAANSESTCDTENTLTLSTQCHDGSDSLPANDATNNPRDLSNNKYHYYDAGKNANSQDDVNKPRSGKDVMPNKLGRMMQASDNAIRSALARILREDGVNAARHASTAGNQFTPSGKSIGLKEKESRDNNPLLQETQAQASEAEPPLLANRVSETHGSQTDMQLLQNRTNGDARKSSEKIRLIRQLTRLDISPIIAQVVADALLSDIEDYKMLLPQALALISNQIPIYKEDVTACGGTVALLGATGVGKTTTIVKMAARYALRHGKDNVAIVTTDDKRLAAAEQLRTYCNIMGFQFKVAQDEIELLDALNTLSDKDFVLIDTAGMGPKDIRSSKYYDLFAGGITQIKNFLVMSATMHRSTLEQSTKAFANLKIDGCIITKMDETTSLGATLSAAILNNLPVAYYSNGQQIPDDFYLARSHILMSRAVSVVNQFEEQDNERFNNQDKVGIKANVSL